jgi:hypothetical protein
MAMFRLPGLKARSVAGEECAPFSAEEQDGLGDC